MPRPTKLTPAMQKAICQAVALGLGYDQAASAAGVHRGTLSEWRKHNPAFSDALEKAEAEGVQSRLRRIEQAAAGGAWQADAWWLERRYPEQWGRRDRMDVKHEGTVDITMLANMRAAILAAVEDVPTRVRIAEALLALEGEGGSDERSA